MAKSRPTIDPQKHQRILDAAMHEFARLGFRDAKTDHIAEAADVSKGLLFNYFGSKANLYVTTVQATYTKITQAADMSVWQDAKDLSTMLTRALRYKIQLQLTYPDEFALAMAAYAEVGSLPAKLRPKVQAIWENTLQQSVPEMVTPVLNRLPLRDGISTTTVSNMILMVSELIGQQAKVMIRQDPQIKIEAFDPVIAQAKQYMAILEHGFLKD